MCTHPQPVQGGHFNQFNLFKAWVFAQVIHGSLVPPVSCLAWGVCVHTGVNLSTSEPLKRALKGGNALSQQPMLGRRILRTRRSASLPVLRQAWAGKEVRIRGGVLD